MGLSKKDRHPYLGTRKWGLRGKSRYKGQEVIKRKSPNDSFKKNKKTDGTEEGIPKKNRDLVNKMQDAGYERTIYVKTVTEGDRSSTEVKRQRRGGLDKSDRGRCGKRRILFQYLQETGREVLLKNTSPQKR